jgi:hypothetical protein
MALTDDLNRRVERKRQEIASLEQQLAMGKAYLQAMEEALKLAERTHSRARQPGHSLRKGSMPAMAYPVLRRMGRKVYLVPLLEEMGVPVTAKNKRSLASSLSAYARRGEIFTRPEPNTFGLIEFKDGKSEDGVEAEKPETSPSRVRLVR